MRSPLVLTQKRVISINQSCPHHFTLPCISPYNPIYLLPQCRPLVPSSVRFNFICRLSSALLSFLAFIRSQVAGQTARVLFHTTIFVADFVNPSEIRVCFKPTSSPAVIICTAILSVLSPTIPLDFEISKRSHSWCLFTSITPI